MCSSYEILLYRLGVCFYLVPNIVERSEGGFATDGSAVVLLKEIVFVINRSCHGG